MGLSDEAYLKSLHQLARERDNQRAAGQTADFIEGVSAFLQKRPAKFTGA